MQDPLPFRVVNDTTLWLFIKLKPNALQTKLINLIQQENKSYFLINVKAAPIENKANKELVTFLAKLFKIPKITITLVKGDKSSYKTVAIKSNNLPEIISKIMELK